MNFTKVLVFPSGNYSCSLFKSEPVVRHGSVPIWCFLPCVLLSASAAHRGNFSLPPSGIVGRLSVALVARLHLLSASGKHPQFNSTYWVILQGGKERSGEEAETDLSGKALLARGVTCWVFAIY